MRIESSRLENGIVVLKLVGTLDAASVTMLNEQVRGIWGTNGTALVDASSLDGIDSAGAKALSDWGQRAMSAGGKVGVVFPSPKVSEILSRTGGLNFLSTFEEMRPASETLLSAIRK